MWDVVIVGGGAAGLMAARKLVERGIRPLLLEARDRLGGRILTLRDGPCSLPVELGAEFVDIPGPAWEILSRYATPILRSAGGWWVRTADGFEPADLRDAIDQALEPLGAIEESGDVAVGEWLDQQSLDPARHEMIRRYVEGFHAARIDRIGARWLARAERGSGGGGGQVRYHLLAGYDRLIDALRAEVAGPCEIRTRSIVTDVLWSGGRVEIRVRDPDGAPLEPVLARCAVIAVPLGVLQAPPGSDGAIHFAPALPGKQSALEHLATGEVVKTVLRFRERIWAAAPGLPRDEDPGDEVKFLIGSAPIPTWWTTSPVLSPLLVGWAGGGYARDIEESNGDLISTVLASLATLLDLPRETIERALEGIYHHDWGTDPFARGAYSYGLVGSDGASEQLALPIADTLFFAGEATAGTGETGTVGAALDSGARAAAEVIERLG